MINEMLANERGRYACKNFNKSFFSKKKKSFLILYDGRYYFDILASSMYSTQARKSLTSVSLHHLQDS